jgi:hypothetical protein
MQNKSLDDLIESGKKSLLDLFVSSKADEFAKFVTDKEQRVFVTNTHRQLSGEVEDARLRAQVLFARLDFAKNCDIPTSILDAVKNQMAPAAIFKIADIFSGPALVRQFEPELRALATKELRAVEDKFKTFKKENAALLKELGLI